METKEDVLNELEAVFERLKYWDITIDYVNCWSGLVKSLPQDDVMSVRHQLVVSWVRPIYAGG